MTRSFSLAQLNPTVGDIEGNAALIRQARDEAKAKNSDLLICSELILCGYPPEDLVLRPAFLDALQAMVAELAAETADGGSAVLLGAPWRDEGQLYNAALLLDGGTIAARRYKYALPNYSVFDEKRLFTPGELSGPINFRGLRLGVMLCEDVWIPEVAECLAESGAEILVVLNASPYEYGKGDQRLAHSVARVKENGLPLIYVNQVGGQDELVFDGASFVLSAQATMRLAFPAWREAVLETRWRDQGDGWTCASGTIAPTQQESADIYAALTLGLRDYVEKNHFPHVLIGLSGGIDSALAAAIAVDALGAQRVSAVMMPSPYTSQASLDDAEAVARNLGIDLETIDIRPAMGVFADLLAPLIEDQAEGQETGLMQENIQSRIRGLLLMALSNQRGGMVLSTGNKSELSVGYTTLYGDMCGGFSVLKDVYKTTVLALAAWRNKAHPVGGLGRQGAVIPPRVITKPPSAELKPDQTDQDSLPPYQELDAVLELLIEQDQALGDVIAVGHPKSVVEHIWRLLLFSEYKRRQAPPGVKISRRAHVRERRYPITNRFLGE